MNKERKLIIAGNWKMNKTVAEALDLVRSLKIELANVKEVDIVVCPPFTALCEVSKAIIDSNIRLGAQNMSENKVGAHTGEIAAVMLKEFSVRYVILGHSERRAYHGETDDMVAAKVRGALRAGLEPIICVGESLADRRGGWTLEVVDRQLRGSAPGELQGQAFTVAYEPVWAIGTGLTPTVPEIEEVHAAIRTVLTRSLGDAGEAAAILYGGSVKRSNAAEILAIPEVGGALVGGASLTAEDFLAIVRAAPSS